MLPRAASLALAWRPNRRDSDGLLSLPVVITHSPDDTWQKLAPGPPGHSTSWACVARRRPVSPSFKSKFKLSRQFRTVCSVAGEPGARRRDYPAQRRCQPYPVLQ